MFFFLFLIIEFYFLITSAVAQIFIPNVELTIPAGVPTREAKEKDKWKHIQ